MKRYPMSRMLKDYGLFRLFLTYVNAAPNDPDSKTEPALAVCRRTTRGGVAYLIPLSAAWKYADNLGHPTEDLLVSAAGIAECLDLQAGRQTLYTLATAIVDWLPELVAAMPYSVALARAACVPDQDAGTFTLTEGQTGKVIREGFIDVLEQQQ